MSVDPFYLEVYEVVRAIPAGKVATYGQVARLAGMPQRSRMAGQALYRVSDELRLPCHRVVNSVGRLAPSWPEQRALLEAEGVGFRRNGCVDMGRYRWKPGEV